MREHEAMLDEKHEELLHRVVDGEASPEEVAELRAWVARLPQAQAYFEDVQKLFRVLHTVRDVEVPADLQRDIIEATRSHTQSAIRSGSQARGWRQPLVWAPEALRARSAATFGLGFASGMALVALVLGGLAERLPWDKGNGVGAIGAADVMRPLDQQSLALGGAVLQVSTGMQGDRVVAELAVRAVAATEIVLDFEEQALRAVGVELGAEPRPGPSASADGIEFAPGKVSIRSSGRAPSGAATYRVTWMRRNHEMTALRVSLRVADQRVERTLHAGPALKQRSENGG
jgi:anti-sigma factor RsiW